MSVSVDSLLILLGAFSTSPELAFTIDAFVPVYTAVAVAIIWGVYKEVREGAVFLEGVVVVDLKDEDDDRSDDTKIPRDESKCNLKNSSKLTHIFNLHRTLSVNLHLLPLPPLPL